MIDFIRYQLLFNWNYFAFKFIWLVVIYISLGALVYYMLDYYESTKRNNCSDENDTQGELTVLSAIPLMAILFLHIVVAANTSGGLDYDEVVTSRFFNTYTVEIEQLDNWRDKIDLYNTYLENDLPSLRDDLGSEKLELEEQIQSMLDGGDKSLSLNLNIG